ncbi:MAG TPA: OsmC family protein [Pyrinomonadaceae bacterium]|jgi:Predicted redox protein, regulator of disulfide bond formation|nr:OsmC family protein [Pyrinomonadaceae bacterium]
MDLRSIQKPLKEKYRNEPGSSRITLSAHGSESESPIACSVEVGQKLLAAQAHQGVGGPGTGACSGDLLLGALAACAQLTCQLVATAMGIPIEHIRVDVDGEMDLAGTLGISKDVPVGFEDIHARFEIEAPEATPEQLAALREKTEQYCVVMQTLINPPKIRTSWNDGK